MTTTTNSMIGSTLPPHLSGASPTTFYCGNMVWQNIVETGKNMFDQKQQVQYIVPTTMECNEPITILNDDYSGYDELHQVAFVDSNEGMLENVPFDNLNVRDKNGNSPLMWAAAQGNEKLVENLIDHGAAVNMQNFVGETALFLAAARGFDKICRLLMENGAESRFATMDGTFPVHIAAAGGHLEVLKTLISHGAFINVVDEEGDSPLHYAVREGRKEVVVFLVNSCGADFGIKNEDLESPLDLANEMDEKAIVEFLSGCYHKHPTSVELPEYHLYFGEDNEMTISKKEHDLSQVQGLIRASRSVATF